MTKSAEIFSLYFGKKCRIEHKFIFILIFVCHYPFLHSNVNRVKGNCSMSIFFLSVKPFATETQMTEKNVLEIDFLWQGIRLRTVLIDKAALAGFLSNFCPVFHVLVFPFLFLHYLFIPYFQYLKVNCSMSILFSVH